MLVNLIIQNILEESPFPLDRCHIEQCFNKGRGELTQDHLPRLLCEWEKS